MSTVRSFFLFVTMSVAIPCLSQGRWGSIWGGMTMHQYKARYNITAPPSPSLGLRYGHDLGSGFRVLLGIEYEWSRTQQQSDQLSPIPLSRTEIASQYMNFHLQGLIRIRSNEVQEWRLIFGGVSRRSINAVQRVSYSDPDRPSEERDLPSSAYGLLLKTGVRYGRKINGRSYGFAEGWAGATLFASEEVISYGYIPFIGKSFGLFPIPTYSIGLRVGYEFGPKLMPQRVEQ